MFSSKCNMRGVVWQMIRPVNFIRRWPHVRYSFSQARYSNCGQIRIQPPKFAKSVFCLHLADKTMFRIKQQSWSWQVGLDFPSA